MLVKARSDVNARATGLGQETPLHLACATWLERAHIVLGVSCEGLSFRAQAP